MEKALIRPRRRFDIITAAGLILIVGITVAYFEIRASQLNFFIREWTVLVGIPIEGPFQDALDHDYLATFGGEKTLSPKAGMAYRMESGELRWKHYESPTNELIFINCNDNPTGRSESVLAYGYGVINAPNDMQGTLGIAADDGIKVWLNGEEIFRKDDPQGFKIDKDIIPIKLKAGPNSLLVKVTQASGGWGVAAHVQFN